MHLNPCSCHMQSKQVHLTHTLDVLAITFLPSNIARQDLQAIAVV